MCGTPYASRRIRAVTVVPRTCAVIVSSVISDGSFWSSSFADLK